MFFMIVNDLLTNVRFIALCHDHLSKAKRKEVWTTIGHVMKLEIVDEEFTSLVEYIRYKLLEPNKQTFEAHWAKEHVEKMADYVGKQMQDFDILHATKVEERKWGWHPFYHLFTSIHALQCLVPTFPWPHNQKETTSLYDDVVCNMKRLQMFDPMPLSARFLILYLFSRRLQSTLVHPLHKNYQKQHIKMVF